MLQIKAAAKFKWNKFKKEVVLKLSFEVKVV